MGCLVCTLHQLRPGSFSQILIYNLICLALWTCIYSYCPDLTWSTTLLDGNILKFLTPAVCVRQLKAEG